MPLKRSNFPFPCGWYGVGADMVIPISLKYFLIVADRNPNPLSEFMVFGIPKREDYERFDSQNKS